MGLRTASPRSPSPQPSAPSRFPVPFAPSLLPIHLWPPPSVSVCLLLTWVLQSCPLFLNSQAAALSSLSEAIAFPLLEGGGTPRPPPGEVSLRTQLRFLPGVSLGPGILVNACVGLMGLRLGGGSHVTSYFLSLI